MAFEEIDSEDPDYRNGQRATGYKPFDPDTKVLEFN